MAYGNELLPLLQLVAQNQRRVNAGMAGQMPPLDAAQPIQVGTRAATPARGRPTVTQRSRTPIAQRPVAAPEMRQQAQAASTPPAGGGGVAGLLQGLSPQERQMMLAATLGGAAGNLSNLLAGRPNAGVGEILLAAGAGGLGGQLQGQQGIQLGRQRDLRGRLLERQVASEEAQAQQEMAQAERLQRILDDPSVPDEMKRIIAMSQAGVPAAGIEAMVPPAPGERYRVVGSDLYDLTAEGGPQMVARGTRDAGPLVPVFDETTGQTVYLTREQAVGQMAPPKSGMRISYDAEGRPIVETGVTPGAGGVPETMQRPTASGLEKSMVQIGDRLERLGHIQQSYKPEFSQVATRAGMEWAALKDKFGELGPQERQSLEEFTTWKQNAFDDLNQTLRDMSGAAVTEHEMGRLVRAAPNPGEGIFDGDSPTEFKAKLDNQIWKAQLAYARLHHYRNQGLPIPDFAAGDHGPVTIEQMPEIIDARGRELEQQFMAENPDAPAELIQMEVDRQLRAEFGFQ